MLATYVIVTNCNAAIIWHDVRGVGWASCVAQATNVIIGASRDTLKNGWQDQSETTGTGSNAIASIYKQAASGRAALVLKDVLKVSRA